MRLLLPKVFFFLSLVAVTSLSAQKLHQIPELDLDKFADGWHQFEVGTISFDVEVQDEKIKKGTIVWEDGSTYMGTIKHHIISGRGTYIWPSSIRYEGRFFNNQRHGRGSYILQDGSKWYGTWQDNKRHGKGRIYDTSGKKVRKGLWEKGREVK